jgi:hypothetical protein
LDYSQKLNINYNLRDALVSTAKTVTSTYGRREPMLIVIGNNGPEL